jgi:hypothetical protein
MSELLRERLSGWGARLSLGALLLVFSEWVVWQTPLSYNALEWAALAAIYLALAAILLDLVSRFNTNEVFSLLLLAGLYGLVDATLISRVTTHDLPLSLLVRPLGAQPLVALAALASFQILTSGRATGPLEFVVALVIGLLWGIWVRWFPVVSDESADSARVGTALVALGVAFAVCLLIRYLVPPALITRPKDWRLLPLEWVVAGGVLGAAGVVAMAQDELDGPGLVTVLMLMSFIGGVLYVTAPARRGVSFLASITPPRRPNPAAWLVLILPFLLAGWLGYQLPGSDDKSIQSDLLFGALAGFGLIWLPAVSMVAGIRAFVRLAREGS